MHESADDTKLTFRIVYYLVFEFLRYEGNGIVAPSLQIRIVFLGITHGHQMSPAPGYDVIPRFKVSFSVLSIREFQCIRELQANAFLFCYIEIFWHICPYSSDAGISLRLFLTFASRCSFSSKRDAEHRKMKSVLILAFLAHISSFS